MACCAPLPLETMMHTPPRQQQQQQQHGSALISPALSDGNFVSPSPIAPRDTPPERGSEARERHRANADRGGCSCAAVTGAAAVTTTTMTTLSTTNVYGISLSIDQERSETDDEAANRRRSVRLVFDCDQTRYEGCPATHPLRLDEAGRGAESGGGRRDAHASVGLSAMTLDKTTTTTTMTRLSATHNDTAISRSSTSGSNDETVKDTARAVVEEMDSAAEDTASDERARITGFPTPVKVPSIPTKGTPRAEPDRMTATVAQESAADEGGRAEQEQTMTMSWQDDHVSISQMTNEDELRQRSHETQCTQLDSLSAPSSLSHTAQHCMAQQTTTMTTATMMSHVSSAHTDAARVSPCEHDKTDEQAASARAGNMTTTLLLQSPSVSLIQTSAEDSRCGRSTVLDGTIYRETLAAVRPATASATAGKADYYYSTVAPARRTTDRACQAQGATRVAAVKATCSVATQTERVARAADATPSSLCMRLVASRAATAKAVSAPQRHSSRKTRRTTMPQLRSSTHTAAIDSWMV